MIDKVEIAAPPQVRAAGIDGECPDPQTLEQVAAELEQLPGVTVLRNEPMSRHTSFGVGGPADLFVMPGDVESLSATIRTLRRRQVRGIFLGNGTNVIVRDGGVRGAVIRLAGSLRQIRKEDGLVIAGGGVNLAALCKYCARNGLGGLKFAAGIPGSVGGAVFMNAGASGGQMADVVEWITIVTAEGEVRLLNASELGFGYRRSGLQCGRYAIAEVGFRFTPADPAELHQALCETILRRCQKQPVAQRSAGSIFKRPAGDYAGRLLEAADAKGMRVGDAVVSTKHANFIVNAGHASTRDVLELIELLRARVQEKFGVRLETEVLTIGDD